MILFSLMLILLFGLTNDWLFDPGHRIPIGGLPVNVIDVLVVLLVIYKMARPGKDRIEVGRPHRLMKWSIGLLIAAIVAGTIGALMNEVPLREFVTGLRDLAAMPTAIWLGYVMVTNIRAAKFIPYLWVFCSLLSAAVVVFIVRGAVGGDTVFKGFDSFRQIHPGGDVGLSAAAILAFGLISRRSILPMPIAILIMLFCIAAICTLPHRSTYLVVAIVLFFAMLVLPTAPVSRRIIMSVVGVVLIFVTLVAGIAVISRLTGRDFKSYLVDNRLRSLMFWNRDESDTSSLTDTRMGGIQAELDLWSDSPLTGKGFAVGAMIERRTGSHGGFNHNVWTSSLAQCGVFGLFGFWVPIFGAMVVGWRASRAPNTDPSLRTLAALCTIVSFMALMYGTVTLSINQQRMGIMVGLAFGMAFRVRDIQTTLALQQEYEGYLEPEDVPYDHPTGFLADGRPARY